MKYFYYLLITIILSPCAQGSEIKCDFEEVYSDGSIQQGFLLIKNDLLRYQYLDKNLFTIFYNSKDFFLVRNDNNKIFQKVEQDTQILKAFMNIFQNYPNLNDNYMTEQFSISLEKSSYNNFYKRISVQSEHLNLSLYLNNCNNTQVLDKYFIFNPYYEIS